MHNGLIVRMGSEPMPQTAQGAREFAARRNREAAERHAREDAAHQTQLRDIREGTARALQMAKRPMPAARRPVPAAPSARPTPAPAVVARPTARRHVSAAKLSANEVYAQRNRGHFINSGWKPEPTIETAPRARSFNDLARQLAGQFDYAGERVETLR